MRILFAAPYIPSRIRVRPFHFIRGLKRLGHSVHFIGLDEPHAGAGAAEELSQFCTSVEIFKIPWGRPYLNCALNLGKRMALQTAFRFSAEFQKRIQEVASSQSFDILHIEHIRAGYGIPEARDIPALYDSVDCITSLYAQFARKARSPLRRLVSWIEYQKLKTYEPHLLSKYDGIIVTTEREKSCLQALAQECGTVMPETRVVSNGVDGDYFHSQDINQEEPGAIVFSGKMGYYANAWAAKHFAQEIFPRIRTKKPGAKFYIVGADPSKEILRLAETVGTVVTGQVPDVRAYLRRAEVVVCPLRMAVGIQNKLLEAMAMGKAVVTYAEGTLGLRPPEEDIYWIAEGTEDFALKVVTLMEHRPLRLSLGGRARSYVEKHYAWEDQLHKLIDFYRVLIHENHKKPIRT
jgi:sugar transferase (PEP-CTERM/EpsH1 system associated)